MTDYEAMLEVAIAEAQRGLAEGGIPIGAALFHNSGKLLGCGHNRRVQEGDPSVHGETDAFRSGLVVQFQIGTVVVGESRTFRGGIDWLRERGVQVVDLQSAACETMLGGFITAYPEIWNEDIGEP